MFAAAVVVVVVVAAAAVARWRRSAGTLWPSETVAGTAWHRSARGTWWAGWATAAGRRPTSAPAGGWSSIQLMTSSSPGQAATRRPAASWPTAPVCTPSWAASHRRWWSSSRSGWGPTCLGRDAASASSSSTNTTPGRRWGSAASWRWASAARWVRVPSSSAWRCPTRSHKLGQGAAQPGRWSGVVG